MGPVARAWSGASLPVLLLTVLFDEISGALISTCGGACLAPDPEQQEICRTLCPPPGW
jgi:hypothetical protein